MKETYAKVLATIQDFIAKISGTEAEDVLPEYHLEDDLGVSMLTEFPKIISLINKEFETQIDAKFARNEVHTVHDLVQLVVEETELG